MAKDSELKITIKAKDETSAVFKKTTAEIKASQKAIDTIVKQGERVVRDTEKSKIAEAKKTARELEKIERLKASQAAQIEKAMVLAYAENERRKVAAAKETAKQQELAAKEAASNTITARAKNLSSSVVAAYTAITLAITAAIYSIKKFTEAWLEQETTTTRLNNAIKKSGQNLDETSEAFSKYVGHMQAMGVSESVVEQNLIKLTKAGLKQEEAIKLNNAAMALGYERYGSFEAGAKAVEMAMVGATKGAKRLGIEIDAGATKAQVYEAFIRKAGDTTATFGDYANTAAGKINAMKEVSAEVQEAIGKGLVGGLINATGTGKDFNKNVEQLIGKLNKVSEVIAVWVIPGIKAFVQVLIDWERVAATPILNTLMAIAAGFTSVYQAATGHLEEAKMSWSVMKNLITGIPSDIGKGWNDLKKHTNDYFNGADKRIKQFNKLGRGTTAISGADSVDGGVGTKTKESAKELTGAEKANLKLKEYQTKAEREIIDANLRGNDALAVRQQYLLEAIAALGKMKDSTEAVYSAQAELNSIANDFADQQQKNLDEIGRKNEAQIEKDIKAEEERLEKQKQIELEHQNWIDEQRRTNGSWAATQSGVREEAARAGGTRGVLGSIFRGVMPGLAESVDRKKAQAETEKEIQLQERLARITGEAYDATGARIAAVIAQIEAVNGDAKATAKLMQELHGLVIKKSVEDAQTKADEEVKAQNEAIEQAQKQQHDELKSMYSDAIMTGMEEGGKAGLQSLGDMIKQKFMRRIADALSDALMGGGFNLGGMGGGGGATPTTGGGGGGILGMLGLGGKGGGKAGGLSSILGYAGMAYALYGMFSKKSTPIQQSGVQPIREASIRGTDTGALYGSDIFQRATFSARNKAGDVTASLMANRMGAQSMVYIVPSKEFDAISEGKFVKTVKGNSMRGIPKRTNFEHGS